MRRSKIGTGGGWTKHRETGRAPARKRFGQHFLEPAWVDRLIEAIDPRRDEVFLEIGPGRGALTVPLATRAHRILAVEIDRHLAAALRRRAMPNVLVLEEDFLRVPAERLRDELTAPAAVGGIRVVGNLPYNVASPILFRLLDLATPLALADATVMVQREVAERLAAPAGSRRYGVLTILVALSASVELLFSLPPGAFRPAPKVHSGLVRLRFRRHEPQPQQPAVFAALVRSIFTRRRKTLVNALKAFPLLGPEVPGHFLELARLDGRRRPETLTVAELVGLSDTFVNHAASVLAAPGRAVL